MNIGTSSLTIRGPHSVGYPSGDNFAELNFFFFANNLRIISIFQKIYVTVLHMLDKIIFKVATKMVKSRIRRSVFSRLPWVARARQ